MGINIREPVRQVVNGLLQQKTSEVTRDVAWTTTPLLLLEGTPVEEKGF